MCHIWVKSKISTQHAEAYNVLACLYDKRLGGKAGVQASTVQGQAIV